MMNRGQFLIKVIEEKGLNIMSLSKVSGVAYTTIRSMIERDLSNASIDNVLKICKVLEINADSLADPDAWIEEEQAKHNVETVAAHHEGDTWTEEELEEIKKFKEFVKSKRQQE
jgi:predicted transcriptional regulator